MQMLLTGTLGFARRPFAVGGSLCVLILALCGSSANAGCPQWDVSGRWDIQQENPTANIELNLIQSGTEITGTARYNGAEGKVKGTLVGDDFSVEIREPNGKHAFRGTVGPARIAGVGPISSTSAPTIWYSTTAMRCGAPGSAGSGAVPKSATSESAANPLPPAQPAVTEGKIWANPQYPTVAAGQVEGVATLTWDGGRNHAGAGVWVKVDDENEKLLVEQAKGSRQVSLKPNKVYLYILKEGGRELDSVTVIAVD